MLLRFLFLVWTTLNIKVPLILRVGRKWKGRAGDNYKSILNIEFEQDCSFILGATLGDRYKIKKYYSSYKDFFREKPIVPYCWGSNVQNIHKIWWKLVEPFLRKWKFKFFFLCELSLILWVDRKRKKELEIFARGP